MNNDTDWLMLELNEALCQDMRLSLGWMDGTSKVFEAAENRDIKAIRESKFTLNNAQSPYTYKWCAQMNALTKRYTFRNDIITKQQRRQRTDAKFIKLQETLASSYRKPLTERSFRVVQLARKICREALAEFDPQGQAARSRYGRKATLDGPAAIAYIDEKLLYQPITGSAHQIIDCISNEMVDDVLLASILKSNKNGFKCCDTLAQINVPKKFDIDRGINPNTLLGSRASDRIGRELELVLVKLGLNISTQQKRHGELARKASKQITRVSNDDYRRSSATADLSDASHGFLSNLLNRLLPRKWFHAVMRGVIRKVEVDGKEYRLESIMTMGIGFTFPLQTLLFYCLLKSIATLSNVPGVISVYGDDLFYPVDLHKYVVGVFSDLGFKLNLDKTYVHSPFRESCGSDFFKGVAVRPFSPEGGDQKHFSDKQYAAFCYKLLNGLLSRWQPEEIQVSRRLLMMEIVRVMGEIFIVPRHMPEESGLCCASSEYADHSTLYDWWIYPYAKWVFDPCLGTYLFPSLKSITGRHYVRNETPYYWDKLRSMDSIIQNTKQLYFDRFENGHLKPPGTPPEAVFKFRNKRGKTNLYHTTKDKRRMRIKVGTVAQHELVTRYEVNLPTCVFSTGSNSL